MATLHRFLVTCACAVLSMLAACDSSAKWKTPNMTLLTPRLQSMFEKTKTVCFGRFLVDVPALATTAWGGTDIPLGVTVYPSGVDEVNALEQKFIDELKSEKAIYLNKIPLLISIDSVAQPEGKVVTGYDGFEALKDLRISGFFRWQENAFIVDARPLMDRKDQVIADIKSIAGRLRPHAEEDIPAEPGNCIDGAFLPDEPAVAHEGELVRVGFRLKEFPDTHISIFVSPSSPNYSQGDSLEWLLDRLEKRQMAEDPNHPNLKTKYFRRGARQIHNWDNGFEVASRTPELPETHSIHSFIMHFRGVPSDPLRPFLDVEMETGVHDNAAGAIRPSLTDEEAIAVWDKITSTIRVRPTTSAAVKTSQANQASLRPLGELAATGRTCPQSGWWQAEKSGKAREGERRHVKKGEVMPHAMAVGELSLWQKLKKEQPEYWTATMWKLISYDEAPAEVDAHKAGGNRNSATQAGKEG
jgi:hypothetical protein